MSQPPNRHEEPALHERPGPRLLAGLFAAMVAAAVSSSCPPAPPEPVIEAPVDRVALVDAGPEPLEEASAEAPQDPEPNPYEVPPEGDWRQYPLPRWCLQGNTTLCTTEDGEPGLRCRDDAECFNPCPNGMGPERGGTYCAKKCGPGRSCKGGTCTAEGVCDRWPDLDACSEETCLTKNDDPGRLCDGRCVSYCKPGLIMVGGTHCAKPCKGDRDCGGTKGACWKDDGPPYFCGLLCPSEGCPYLYE